MSYLELHIDQHLATITHVKPESKNSFGVSEAKELTGHLEKVRRSKAKALLWRSGLPGYFCTGGDLSYYAKLTTREEGVKANQYIAEALEQLEKLERPTICCVNGLCLGGGMELLSAFDFVASTPNSLFGFWQRKIALSLGWGGGARWKKRVPEKLLRQLLMEARSFSAYEALNKGLIDKVSPYFQLQQFMGEYLDKIHQLPQQPFANIKLSPLEEEKAVFESLWMNEEHRKILLKWSS